MKKISILLLLIPLLLSCTGKSNKAGVPARMKKQVMSIATDYSIGKFKNAKKTIGRDGIISVGENQINYVIDPAKIYAGLIDDDTNEDAIVSIDYYNGQNLVLTEHLFLINTNGKLMLNRAIESDMKIIGIKNGIITAEIYTRSRNSPLANCSLCKEVVKYRFRQGELIKTE